MFVPFVWRSFGHFCYTMLIMAKHIKIIGINSSPRQIDGPAQQASSTRILLPHALDKISARADTEIIDLVDYKLDPSSGCYSTSENLNGLHCKHYNDQSQEIFNKIIGADGVIFSSPVYWLESASRMSILFERLTELDPITRDTKKRLLQGKVAGAIATAHVDGAAGVCYSLLMRANYLGFIIPPHPFAFHTTGQNNFVVMNKDTLKEDFVALRGAEMVAENVLQMCKLVRDHKDDWTVYYELTRPMSNAEESHAWHEAAEKKRIVEEHFLKKNEDGSL